MGKRKNQRKNPLVFVYEILLSLFFS